uniref:Protein kinase domain-containing protein n=1 Tax=Hanusia phi TaxID=3032 RepID=A0A7S0E3V9_9CRYP|mmetsp:Transcript_16275/g.37177  ORF Transcript_16275/g.37177 Transcript_16275/m.37177 type:complete len:504 (+) Transcript_16275:245-1756(+)
MEVMDERRETTFCARKHSPELLPSLPPVGPSAAPHAQQHPSRIETENTYHDPNAALTTKSITLSMEDVNEDQALESRKLGRFPPPGHGRLVKESSLSLSHNYLYTVAESNESDQDASVHLPPEVSCGDPVSGFLPFNQCEVAIYDDDNPVEVEGDFTSTMTGNLYRGTFCGKEVLVKRLKSSDVGDPTKPVYKDLLLEAKIMTMVGMHKNVAFLHGVQMSEFLMPNLIIDKPGGPNLQDFFGIWREKHKGGLKKPTIFAWSKDLLRGLSYLHERSQPILHRDIRPANLRLSEDLRTLKIYGFEAATMYDIQDTSIPLNSRRWLIHFSPNHDVAHDGNMEVPLIHRLYTGGQDGRYLAPEVSLCNAFGMKADVYGCALVMWEMCSGKQPFGISDIKKIPSSIKRQIPMSKVKLGEQAWSINPKDIANLNLRPDLKLVSWRALRDLIEQAWDQKPSKRPSAVNMLQQLETLHGCPSEKADPAPRLDLESRAFYDVAVSCSSCKLM